MDSYGEDLVKKKSRFEIYKFADSYLPKDCTQGTALYLAAANCEESELVDRLGIPRSNRIILESDVSKVKAVREANPGILVIPITCHEFFKSEYKNPEYQRFFPLWYCGLDYEEMLNERVLGDLENIAKKELVVDGGILYTNLVSHRENDNLKALYVASNLYHMFLATNNIDKACKCVFGEKEDIDPSVKRALRKVLRMRKEGEYEGMIQDDEMTNALFKDINFKDINLRLLREQGISSIIHAVLLNTYLIGPPFVDFWIGREITDIFNKSNKYSVRFEYSSKDRGHYKIFEVKISKCDLPQSQIPQESIIHIPQGMTFAEYTRVKALQVNEPPKVANTPLEVLISDLDFISQLYKKIDDLELEEILESCENKTMEYYKRGGLDVLSPVIRGFHSKGYYVKDTHRFSYISNKNTPMMLDILHIHKIQNEACSILNRLFEEKVKIFYTSKRPYLFTDISPKCGNSNICLECLKKESDMYSKRLHKEAIHLISYDPLSLSQIFLKRISLGSSYIPPLREKDARRYASENKSIEEIKKIHHVSKKMGRKYRAFVACKTMGKLRAPGKKEISVHEEGIKKNNGSNREVKDLPKYLLSHKIYHTLPWELKARIEGVKDVHGGFMNDCFYTLPKILQINLRKAISLADFNIEQNIDPYRFYAFFDAVQNAALGYWKDERGKPYTINAEFLRNQWNYIKNLPKLVTTVPITTSTLPQSKKECKKVPEKIKEEIRSLRHTGFSIDDIWTDSHYRKYLESKKQLSAICAWAHPNLSAKRKNPH